MKMDNISNISTVEASPDIVSNSVGISAEDTDYLASLLTTNLYANPLKSFFREIVSNAYDSMIEANSDMPVLIILKEHDDITSITIKDYGTGISPERFNSIFRFLGKSTKRQSNDYIGGFGIGRFASLAATKDTVLMTSNYNGFSYDWVMYKDGDSIHIDELGSTQSTDSHNGFEVTINTSKISIYNLNECLNTISMFDKVFVKCANDYRCKELIDLFNDRKIYSSKK